SAQPQATNSQRRHPGRNCRAGAAASGTAFPAACLVFMKGEDANRRAFITNSRHEPGTCLRAPGGSVIKRAALGLALSPATVRALSVAPATPHFFCTDVGCGPLTGSTYTGAGTCSARCVGVPPSPLDVTLASPWFAPSRRSRSARPRRYRISSGGRRGRTRPADGPGIGAEGWRRCDRAGCPGRRAGPDRGAAGRRIPARGLLFASPVVGRSGAGWAYPAPARCWSRRIRGASIGTVVLEPFHRFGEIARNPVEAEVQALAVARHEQHRAPAGRSSPPSSNGP